MRPVPMVTMDEVIAQLSERGKLEWELATTKATLAKALADPSELAESGHIPAPEPTPEPSPTPADVPATNQLTTPES